MLIEILLFLILGILAGTFTGMIPGIHINLIGAFLIAISTKVFINPVYSIVFITPMATTHTFIDFVPSIFLGCPDTDTELSILPGHEMLKNKRGYEAVQLSNIGSLTAILIVLVIAYPSMIFMKNIYGIVQNIIPYILITTSAFLILTEKRKFTALFIFLLTGLFGYGVSFLEVKQSLLPILTGLFGISGLFVSIKNKTKIPEQIITKPKINLRKPILKATLTAPICSLLPGMGSGQAAVLASSFSKTGKKEFIVLLGIINTIVMTFSFLTFFSLQKTRTGAVLAINELTSSFEIQHLILAISIIIISGIIAFFITKYLAKKSAKIIEKINYQKLSIAIILSLGIINLIVSGVLGFVILIVSSMIGVYAVNQKVRRTNMIGVLILPTIIWFLT